MKKIFLVMWVLAVVLLLSSPATSSAASLSQEVDELRARLEVLEAEVEESNHKFSGLFEVGGYADTEYIVTDKGDDENGFRVHHLSFHFVKQISDKWRLFSEVEFEDGPKLGEEETLTITDDLGGIHTVETVEHKEGKIFVETFTLGYQHNRQVNFFFGRYLVPGGIWNVDHYTPFVPTQERPQHIRKIFPQINDGVQFYGTKNLSGIVTDYTAYVGNGSGNSGHGDGNANTAAGARLKFKFPNFHGAELGFSGYTETDNDDTERTAQGVDLKLRWKDLKFQGEYAMGDFDLKAAGADFDRSGYYGQLIYGIGKLDFIYRYDWYDAADIVVKGDKEINTFALNYHFTPSVVGKLETHFNEFEDSTKENYNKTIFSIAVYLGEL